MASIIHFFEVVGLGYLLLVPAILVLAVIGFSVKKVGDATGKAFDNCFNWLWERAARIFPSMRNLDKPAEPIETKPEQNIAG